MQLATERGATVLLEPEWGVAGSLTFPNKRHAYFMFSTLHINGASEIVRDKGFTQFFMRSMGYPTVRESQTFFTETWANLYGSRERLLKHAHKYASGIGYPVFVKPNKGSQGRHVTLAHNRKELESALRDVFTLDHIALVQKPEPGNDFRVVVYKGKVVCAYGRFPLTLTGDGVQSIATLLQQHIAETGAHLSLTDSRIARSLTRKKKHLTTILKKGERLTLLDNANLSTGGYAVDVTKTFHPYFKKLAINVARDFNLTLAGVDILIDGDHTRKPTGHAYVILELNSAPGLDHYAQLSPEAHTRVEKLYRTMLHDLSKKRR